ncbi:ABC transporter ATP-binding protein [Nitratireductor kimnyeongensis]|uniref:ABC transporter ATP-binding protein n=1 Tax=Nitratireductor kimnyeongensis TaxID=430679 RepID=A0ABW0T4F9_9HYPH|nr:ABC transporter ATP-binding protein [Nitratireductor kimnyeongensis]QZZ34770.1 ABC transporter ATP-binding protein [Nitratireductor kimnyeongensis]
MLKVTGLEAGYGVSQVLFGMEFEVPRGSVTSLIGRNGMGKTTTIHTILGMVRARGGDILLEGDSITALQPNAIARRGIGLVPEGRRVFPSLTVEENLVATSRPGGADGWNLKRIYDLFPRLKERSGQFAATLSGGEQQMLAVGRALLTNPALLILDEATEGLAPVIRADIWATLRQLKELGQSILVVDKNLKEMAPLVDRHHIVEKGRVVWQGSPQELAANEDLAHRYLGV